MTLDCATDHSNVIITLLMHKIPQILQIYVLDQLVLPVQLTQLIG